MRGTKLFQVEFKDNSDKGQGKEREIHELSLVTPGIKDTTACDVSSSGPPTVLAFA